MLLFLSNLLALVLAGTFVFMTLGYTAEAQPGRGRRLRRLTVGLLVVLVTIPLALNTTFTVAYGELVATTRRATERWLAGTTGAEVMSVENRGLTLVVRVAAPAALPRTDRLMSELSTQLPSGVPVVLERSFGERVDLGSTR